MTSNLVDWLFTRHPFFTSLAEHIFHTIDTTRPASLDTLVTQSRRTVRSALLALDYLERKNRIVIDETGMRPADAVAATPRISNGYDAPLREPDRSVFSAYCTASGNREEPALFWTQRRLVPHSAMQRCNYIRRFATRDRSRVLFLGEDDLVSPLLSATEPGWDVHALDIDSEVLATVDRVAAELGASVTCMHRDLSLPADLSGTFDIVVCDPFPSGDGDFEALFWSRAHDLLRPGGTLISTISPSHKPVGYEQNALIALARLGFVLVDLQVNFGKYETFDFEFTQHEQAVLDRLGLSSTISQTKSLFAALAQETGQSGDANFEFDFRALVRGTAKHYLTVQAGQQAQENIARERGIAPCEFDDGTVGGLRIDLLLPDAEHASTAHLITRLRTAMQEDGYLLSAQESAEIERLGRDAALPDTDLAAIGLAIRAVESWTRWSMQAVPDSEAETKLATRRG